MHLAICIIKTQWHKTNFAGFWLNSQNEMKNNVVLNTTKYSSFLATLLCTSEQIRKASVDLYSQKAPQGMVMYDRKMCLHRANRRDNE